MSSTEQAPRTSRVLAASLWFPAFFVVGFMLFYLLPFHAAAPHALPVSVVGQQAATSLSAGMEHASPGGFDVTPVADTDAARRSVLDRDAVAGYVPDEHTLFVAGADGKQLTQVAQSVFTPVSAASGGTLHVVDVAPTAPGDALGTSVFYVVMAWNIAGYIVVMMMMQATSLRRRTKLLTIAGFGAFATLCPWLFALSVDAIAPNPAVLLIGFMLTQAVSWVTFGLARFVGRALPGVAMGLFVLLSIPSSGGALPKEMVKGFFQSVHYVMPLGNAVDAVRDLMYFGGDGVVRPVLVLLAWMALGALLIALGVRRDRTVESDAGDRSGEGDSGVGVLRGEVVDTQDGRPVPGAVVTLTDTDGRQVGRAPVDGEGGYELGPVRVRAATVVVSAPGHRPTSERVDVLAGSVHRHYRLAPRAGAHGTDGNHGAVVTSAVAGSAH